MMGFVRVRTGCFGRLSLLLLLTTLALLLAHTHLLHRWDLLIYDWSLALTSREPADDLVIVAVDEQSLRGIGRWPWSRRVHADLIRILSAGGAKAIALDIVFSEPQTSDTEADTALASAMLASGRVVLPVLNEQTRVGGQLLETLPIPVLVTAAAGIGHVDVELDPDGMARGVYLRAGLGSPHWSTLALALLETIDATRWQVLPGQRTQSNSTASPYHWQRDYHVLIPFAGPPGHFRHISYRDVLSGHVAPTTFRDRLVLVGSTATGLGDTLPTPVSGLLQPMSGVEFNANILDALRNRLLIESLPHSTVLLLTGLWVLLPLVLYVLSPPRWILLITGLALTLTLIGTLVLLHGAQRWFPPAAVLLVQGLSYPLWIGQRLQQAVYALFDQRQRAHITLQSIGDAVITTDAKGRVDYLNPVAEQLLDGESAMLRGQPLGAIFQVIDEQGHYQPVDLAAGCLAQQQLVRLPEPSLLLNHQGQEYNIRASAAPMWNRQGELSGVVITFSNITETRRLTAQMLYQATHDPLTQLPNLSLLRDRFQHALERAQRHAQGLALLLIDLDHFKKINEGLGRTAGDALLQAIATRLLDCVRKEATLVRAGSDEFIGLLEDVEQEDRIANVAHRILQNLTSPFQMGEKAYFVSASIGISVFPKDGQDVDTLLKNADSAMSRAKAMGRDNFQFYAHDMNVRALARLTMEHDLRYALERHELELYYQPQLDLHQNRITGVEALLRWRHPQQGFISPMDFVPLAEETGLINSIGEWVLKTACQQAKLWDQQGLPHLCVAVNISARQFLRSGMVDTVTQVLHETGLEPHRLDLELTESLLMHDVTSGIATLHALKAIGITLSIDDFGTGYSSLNYLKQFPIDQLKIDQSFLRESASGPHDVAIILAIIAMAHSMNLSVIAEGVETEEQLAFLRAHQCDHIQGYYLSRPVPPEQLAALCEKPPI